MRITVILAVAFAVILPACKSKPPQDVEQLQTQVPDAKPTLHVAEDDPRFVPTAGDTSRQVHYYSAKTDTTYVIDEKTGKIIRTFKSKEMPGVVVVDKPAYQPPPLKAAEPEQKPAEEVPAEGCAPSKEGCAEGCAPTEESGEEEGMEEVEGCGEGCGSE